MTEPLAKVILDIHTGIQFHDLPRSLSTLLFSEAVPSVQESLINDSCNPITRNYKL